MNTKKIALFGTDKGIVLRVVEEALKRGHSVTAIVPDSTELKLKNGRFNALPRNLINRNEVSKLAKEHDVILCLHEPTLSHPTEHIEANRTVIEGAKHAGVQHIISLGHPISLRLEGSKVFHNLWRPLAEAQRETLRLFKNTDGLCWGYIHSVELNSNQQAAKYSISNEIYITGNEGKNKVIDVNQIIKAILDEAEKKEYVWEEIETHL